MRAVGVRELREKTAEILRDVSERGETIQITHHGKVMAHLVPPPKTKSPEEIKRALDRAHTLMEKIGERATEPTDSSTLMREERSLCRATLGEREPSQSLSWTRPRRPGRAGSPCPPSDGFLSDPA
jgi:prevent-host-death family protein